MFIISFIFFYCISYLLFSNLSKKLHVSEVIFNVFYLVKFIYILYFIYFNITDPFATDTKAHFYNNFKFDSDTFIIGDNLIYGINLFFSEILLFNFTTVNLFTIFPSFLSTLLLLSIISEIDNGKKKIILYLILIIPSINFWTIGMNKDMFSHLSLSIFLYGIYKKNFFLIVLSLVLTFFIRPYLTFVILISLLVILFFKIIFQFKSNFTIKNIFLIFMSISVVYFVLLFLLGPFGIQFIDGEIPKIIKNLQSHYTNSRLGIPVDQIYVLRLFNYLFYPLPWSDQTTEFALLIIMFENFLILFVFIYLFISSKSFMNKNYLYFFGLMSFTLLLIMLSLITSNYGIAFRQKWMIIPFLLILLSINFKKKTNF